MFVMISSVVIVCLGIPIIWLILGTPRSKKKVVNK